MKNEIIKDCCDNMVKTLLHEISWVEAKKYFGTNDIVLLPVGSTEQHGPQNPLGTDHLIARAIAEEAAKRTNVLCLPVVPFGVSSHHRQFWGTIFVPPKVFREYVKQVCLSLKYYGIKKIVIVNGHGGNTSTLSEMARELRRQGMFISVFIWWRAVEKLLPDLFTPEERRHASAEETSMNLALYPHLVEMAKATDAKPAEISPFLRAMIEDVRSSAITLPYDFVDYTESGPSGKSTTASVEKGKKVFEASVNALIKHLEVVKGFRIEDLLPKRPV